MTGSKNNFHRFYYCFNVALYFPLQALVDMIQCLQTEMTTEQEYFNELCAQLAHIDEPNSHDGRELSARMITSQTRLTDLVNRNMKCFMLVNYIVFSVIYGIFFCKFFNICFCTDLFIKQSTLLCSSYLIIYSINVVTQGILKLW